MLLIHTNIATKVSKLHPIVSKSLKTITMISAAASTAHQEQVLTTTKRLASERKSAGLDTSLAYKHMDVKPAHSMN
jgi:hypothetical protein